MTTLFLYTIKSAIVLSLLYVPYTLMLRREKMLRFNRITLLTILALSLVLPLCNISALSLDDQPVVHVAQQQLIDIGIPLRQVTVTASGVYAEESTFSWFTLVSFVYFVGMALVLLTRMIQLSRMGLIIRRGSLWQQKEGNITIYCHADEVASFSWLGDIVISQKDYEENGREIVLHEKGHILCHHSWDVILLTLVEMLQWWNPLCYMLGSSLRDIHEFEADDYVLRQGISARGYQMLLINKAVGSSSYTFANNFNHSQIINRITMMQKQQSNPWMRSKVLYTIPVALLSLSAFATPEFTKPIEQTVTEFASKGKQNMADVQVKIEEITPAEASMMVEESAEELPVLAREVEKDDDIVNAPDELPRFGQSDADLYKLLSENMKYPKIAQECFVQGRVMLQFVVEADGKVSNFKVMKSPTPGDNVRKVEGEGPDVIVTSYKMKEGDTQYLSEAEFHSSRKALEAEAIRVMQLSSGKWKPGKVKGKAVRTRFTIPVMFRMQ